MGTTELTLKQYEQTRNAINSSRLTTASEALRGNCFSTGAVGVPKAFVNSFDSLRLINCEHSLHKTEPHKRQWCFLFIKTLKLSVQSGQRLTDFSSIQLTIDCSCAGQQKVNH